MPCYDFMCAADCVAGTRLQAPPCHAQEIEESGNLIKPSSKYALGASKGTRMQQRSTADGWDSQDNTIQKCHEFGHWAGECTWGVLPLNRTPEKALEAVTCSDGQRNARAEASLVSNGRPGSGGHSVLRHSCVHVGARHLPLDDVKKLTCTCDSTDPAVRSRSTVHAFARCADVSMPDGFVGDGQ